MEEELALAMDAGAGGQPAEWQMQDLQYATPQQLLDMQQNNRASFERNIKEVLENAWEYVRTGHLRPSDLKLPMQLAPYPTHVTPLTGYEGGEYHPKKLGVGSTVVPPSEGRGSDTKGGWRVRCDGAQENTSEPGLRKAPMKPEVHKNKSDPDLPGRYWKYTLEHPPVDPMNFLAPDDDAAPAATTKVPFVLMHERKEPIPARDVATPVGFAAASETTPEDVLDKVMGSIEHLSFEGPATSSDGGAGAGDAINLNTAILSLFMASSVSGAAGAMRLKTLGNQHFLAGEFLSALRFYSEAIQMLEGAGDDAALATLLCNRSAAYLNSCQPGVAMAALDDAGRARALGWWKAPLRCAEALSRLGRFDAALMAYKDALANSKAGVNMSGVRVKIEELQLLRVEMEQTFRTVAAAHDAHGSLEDIVTAHASTRPTGKGRFIPTIWVGLEGISEVFMTVVQTSDASDWTGTLELEGRLEELLENQSNATCVNLLRIFVKAYTSQGGLVSGSDSALKALALEKRCVEHLGKMERFRDQGEVMNLVAMKIFNERNMNEAERWFQRTRKLGEKHGFFSMESLGCTGLGRVALEEGREEEGLGLLRNAWEAARLDENENSSSELSPLELLIPQLIKIEAFDEVEPLVLRLQEVAEEQTRREGRFSFDELLGLYLSALLRKGRGRPHQAVNELRSLLDLVRTNEAAVRGTLPPLRQMLLESASKLCKELYDEIGDEEIKTMEAELVELLAGE